MISQQSTQVQTECTIPLPTRVLDDTGATLGAESHQRFGLIHSNPSLRLSSCPVGTSQFIENFEVVSSNQCMQSQTHEEPLMLRACVPYQQVRKAEVKKRGNRSCLSQITSIFGNILLPVRRPVIPSPLDVGSMTPLHLHPPYSTRQADVQLGATPKPPQAAHVRWRRQETGGPFLDTVQRAKRIDLGHYPGGTADEYFFPPNRTKQLSPTTSHRRILLPNGLPAQVGNTLDRVPALPPTVLCVENECEHLTPGVRLADGVALRPVPQGELPTSGLSMPFSDLESHSGSRSLVNSEVENCESKAAWSKPRRASKAPLIVPACSSLRDEDECLGDISEKPLGLPHMVPAEQRLSLDESWVGHSWVGHSVARHESATGAIQPCRGPDTCRRGVSHYPVIEDVYRIKAPEYWSALLFRSEDKACLAHHVNAWNDDEPIDQSLFAGFDGNYEESMVSSDMSQNPFNSTAFVRGTVVGLSPRLDNHVVPHPTQGVWEFESENLAGVVSAQLCRWERLVCEEIETREA